MAVYAEQIGIPGALTYQQGGQAVLPDSGGATLLPQQIARREFAASLIPALMRARWGRTTVPENDVEAMSAVYDLIEKAGMQPPPLEDVRRYVRESRIAQSMNPPALGTPESRKQVIKGVFAKQKEGAQARSQALEAIRSGDAATVGEILERDDIEFVEEPQTMPGPTPEGGTGPTSAFRTGDIRRMWRIGGRKVDESYLRDQVTQAAAKKAREKLAGVTDSAMGAPPQPAMPTGKPKEPEDNWVPVPGVPGARMNRRNGEIRLWSIPPEAIEQRRTLAAAGRAPAKLFGRQMIPGQGLFEFETTEAGQIKPGTQPRLVIPVARVPEIRWHSIVTTRDGRDVRVNQPFLYTPAGPDGTPTETPLEAVDVGSPLENRFITMRVPKAGGGFEYQWYNPSTRQGTTLPGAPVGAKTEDVEDWDQFRWRDADGQQHNVFARVRRSANGSITHVFLPDTPESQELGGQLRSAGGDVSVGHGPAPEVVTGQTPTAPLGRVSGPGAPAPAQPAPAKPKIGRSAVNAMSVRALAGLGLHAKYADMSIGQLFEAAKTTGDPEAKAVLQRAYDAITRRFEVTGE